MVSAGVTMRTSLAVPPMRHQVTRFEERALQGERGRAATHVDAEHQPASSHFAGAGDLRERGRQRVLPASAHLAGSHIELLGAEVSSVAMAVAQASGAPWNVAV